MSDAELLNLYIQDDDHEAFRRLVERHAGMVYGVAVRRSGSPDVAEEATQTVFIQLAKKAGALKQPERVAGWLHRSVLLETAHLLRKTRREQAGKDRLAHSVAIDTEEDWNALTPVIDEALNQLPASDRDLLLAKYYQGFTYGEIATQQQRPEATARKQGSRALEKLQRLLVRQGVTVSAVALGTALKPGLSVACPVGLVDVIEGRVADLATGKGAALTTSLASAAMASPWTLLVITGIAALLPATLGWGRRVSIEAEAIADIDSVRPSLLESTRILPAGGEPLPTIEEILAAHGSDQLGLLVNWLPESDVESLALLGEGLSQDFARHSESITSERFWALFLQRWLTLDSNAAVVFVAQARESDQPFISHALRDERLYVWWAQVDPAAALASAKTKSMSLAVTTLDGLADIDPTHALELASTLPGEVTASLDWSALFKHLAKQDPAAALEAANALSNARARDQALQECIKRIGQDDPEHALNQIDAISGFTASEEARQGIMESWFESDVASAVRALDAMKSSLGKVKLTRSATLAWAKQDPDAALAWAANQESPSLKRAAYAGMAVAFAGTDIERATEAFRQLDWDLTDIDTSRVRQTSIASFRSESDARVSLDHAASQLINKVAARNRGEALRLAGSFKDGPGNDGVYTAKQDVSRKWLSEDPQGFERFIVGQEDSGLKLSLAQQYATEALSVDEAIPWAKSLGGDSARFTLKEVFTKLAEEDSEAAIEKLPELDGLPGETQGAIVKRVVYATDPSSDSLSKVADWLVEQPDQEGLFHGYEGLVFRMAERDEAAATTFVEEQAEGPARGGVIAGMLIYLMSQEEKDHGKVLQWLLATEETRSREFWLPRLAEEWLKNDPKTAIKVIPNTGLDPESWKRLLDQYHTRR